jgi:predicted transcriptional regulator
VSDRITTGVRLPTELHAALKALAAKQDRSINFLVVQAAEEFLARLEPVEPSHVMGETFGAEPDRAPIEAIRTWVVAMAKTFGDEEIATASAQGTFEHEEDRTLAVGLWRKAREVVERSMA